jgi:hypothetical protein
VLTITGFPTATTPGPARRDEPARLSLSLVHARDPAGQDRRDEAADEDPAAMVRQAQKHRRHPEGGDDQRAIRAGRYRCREQGADADMALQELGADMAGIAYVTATVTVWDADPRRADEKLRLVEKIIQAATSASWSRRSMPSMPGSAPARPCLCQCPAATDLARSISPT